MKCDHNGGHTVPSGGGTWGVDWLVAHRYGQPSPFAGASERPAGFPTICNAPNAAP